MIKNKIIYLIITILSIISFSGIYAQNEELSLLGKIIYIDPGHQ